MPRVRAAVFTALVAVVGASPSPASAATHPHFDDRGTLVWYRTLPEAQAAARASGKLIFVESGRLECGSCRKLVERTIPQEPIRSRLAAIAVGLADDCDVSGSAAGALLSRNLPGATFLPLVGFVTADGRWVTGWFGGVTPAQVLSHLEIAEKARGACEAPRAAPVPPPSPAATPTPMAPRAAPPVGPRAPSVPPPAVSRSTPEARRYAPPAPRYATPAPRYAPPAPRYVAPAPRATVPAPRAPAPAPLARTAPRPPAASPPTAPRATPAPLAATPRPESSSPPAAPAPCAPATPTPLARAGSTPPLHASGSATDNDPVTRARIASDSGDWGTVLKIWERAGDARDASLLAELSPYAERAHLWCLRQVDDAEQAARDRRYDDAMRSLDLVRRSLEGTTCPIAVDAERGERAIERLTAIERGSPDQADAPEALRRRAYQEFRGSRWAPLFRSRS